MSNKTITHGNPSHPPLIFLHGFLGAKEDWIDMFGTFEKQFYCISWDLPGHGSTPYCDDILSVLKKTIPLYSSSKPVFVGYSMGGRIALQLQEYASALVILSAHPGLTTKKEREARRKIDEIWSEKLLRITIEEFLAQWYAQPIFQHLQNHPSLLNSIIHRRMKQNPEDLSKVLRQLSLANQPASGFFCPCLFLYGEEDLKYRELYCRLPKTVSLSGIPDCGHMIHLEKPKECAEIILNWLLHARA